MNYVTRAEKALRTGQLQLAELYMRRGLSESAEGRRWLRRFDFGRDVARMARESGMVIAGYIPGRI
jgi:hypothetical protein